MIFELDDAFNRALYDDNIAVIILAADGRNFSAGHDISDTVEEYKTAMQSQSRRAGHWSGFEESATHGWYASEKEGYLETARRWRNIAKPTLCAVCRANALPAA